MNIKIYGGTAKGNSNLCDQCCFAHIVRGQSGGQMIRCEGGGFPIQILKSVSECNRFKDLRWSGHNEENLEKIALILDGSHMKVGGFK